MKVLLRKIAASLSLLVLFTPAASGGLANGPKLEAQASTAAIPAGPATVLRVKLSLEKDSPIMEITSTRPVRPVITRIEDPPALRIDLNNAQISVDHKQIPVRSPLIEAIHLDQVALTPPVVRIVVNELKPLSFTWDAAGNRLTIRLHMESEEAKAKPPSATELIHNTEPVAVPVNAEGPLVFADRLASGTSFSAKFNTETLRLSRGGEVHVCPGTTVTIVHPQNGPDLMLAMDRGALETHYALDNSADTIVTPDFRILLRGPGEFHYAIRADSQGNTCVRALPGSTAPLVVYESIGNGQFQVVASEKLIFHGGHLSTTDTAFHSEHLTQVETVVPDDCGCPAPVPVLRAELAPAPVLAENNISSDATTQSGMHPSALEGTETMPLPSLGPDEKPVKFATSLVFTRNDVPPRQIDLPLSSRRIPFPDASVAAPPALPQVSNKKTNKRAFRKFTGFLSRIFR